MGGSRDVTEHSYHHPSSLPLIHTPRADVEIKQVIDYPSITWRLEPELAEALRHIRGDELMGLGRAVETELQNMVRREHERVQRAAPALEAAVAKLEPTLDAISRRGDGDNGDTVDEPPPAPPDPPKGPPPAARSSRRSSPDRTPAPSAEDLVPRVREVIRELGPLTGAATARALGFKEGTLRAQRTREAIGLAVDGGHLEEFGQVRGRPAYRTAEARPAAASRTEVAPPTPSPPTTTNGADGPAERAQHAREDVDAVDQAGRLEDRILVRLKHGPMKIPEIAALLATSPAIVAQHVGTMKRENPALVAKDFDKVKLTPAGEQYLEDLRASAPIRGRS